MNAEDLKTQLNHEASGDVRSMQHLTNMLKRNASSTVNNILKSFRTEIAFSVFFTIACVYVTFTNTYWSLRAYFGIFIFMGAAFAVILSYLYRRTKKTELSPLPMR